MCVMKVHYWRRRFQFKSIYNLNVSANLKGDILIKIIIKSATNVKHYFRES